VRGGPQVSEASANLVYTCDQWEIDLGRREVRLRGIPVPLGGRAFEIVAVLVESGTELVGKDHMMERVWPGVIVGEGTIHVHISAVRKAFGQDRAMLKTVTGRGYRLLGHWTPQRREATTAPGYAHLTRTSGVSPPNNFPPVITRLIGRAPAAQFVRDLVSAYRVVTLTGPGGVGKTSLAVKVVRYLLPEFEDGGWIVELASLSDPGLVPSTVASTFGLKLDGEISPESVARAVGGRHLLLLLDNCEHVIDAVASLAETFTRVCPRATILATSREILKIDGEYVYRVPPLDVPALGQVAPDYIMQCSAVELFVERTKAMDAAFSPPGGDLASIAAICRRLDGIPLAIEFAAARAGVLGVQQVTAGLRNRFALLTDGRRTALPRQQTLRATLDWSHELLPDGERLLLRRLAVFPAGFTIDAAAAIMTDTGFDAPAVLDGIANLIAKSWVVPSKSDAAARWSLLETIRAYALEKLVEHGEADVVARHHALYFRNLLAPASSLRPQLSDEDLERSVREIDNVRTALDWSFSSTGDQSIGVDLTCAYAPVWRHLSLMGECRERCERALLGLESRGTTKVRLRMELQIALASAMFITMGPSEPARTLLTDALEAADTLNDLDAQVRALLALVSIYAYSGEYRRARITRERIAEIAARVGDPGMLLVADRQAGFRLLTSGRHHEAQQYFERVLQSSAVPGDRFSVIYYRSNDHAASRALLARALWMQGFPEQALNEARLSLEELRGTDDQLLLCRTLYMGTCRISPMVGDLATADRDIPRLIEVAKGLRAQFWETAGRFLEGKSLIERGEFAQGVPILRDAFETCDRSGWTLSYPEFKGTLARGLAGLGQLDEALGAVEDALARAGHGPDGQTWYVPELLRIKGEVLLQQAADESAAEECFDQAAIMAHEQGALFWELRIALSVSRLRVRQGRPHEARASLATVYDRFTEGFATADLQAARTALDWLQS
jgi:predicted ATPase/DNA-binding winged helix-turn-helix (wHTH) protein